MTSAVIDVNGVGYGVEMPEPTVLRLVDGELTTILTERHRAASRPLRDRGVFDGGDVPIGHVTPVCQRR